MLQLGVFEGWYLNSARKEYPAAWFLKARMAESGADPTVNAFRVKSRQPLSVWRENGWINEQDPRGWFEWYCRFYQGRRSEDDDRQIKRWRAFVRHSAQVKKNGMGRVDVRPVQRQALLQWAHDPFPDAPSLDRESALRKTKRLLKPLTTKGKAHASKHQDNERP
jgi:hypothetical protein